MAEGDGSNLRRVQSKVLTREKPTVLQARGLEAISIWGQLRNAVVTSAGVTRSDRDLTPTD